MINPGNPFRSGTLSSVLFSAILTLVIAYYYIQASINHAIFLTLIAVCLYSTVRLTIQYRKRKDQRGNGLVGDQT